MSARRMKSYAMHSRRGWRREARLIEKLQPLLSNPISHSTETRVAPPLDLSKMEVGIYFVYNCKAGAVIDVSGTDSRSIIGFPWHGLENQQVSAVPTYSVTALRPICVNVL